MPFFYLIIYQLPLYEILCLMEINKSMYRCISETNLYRILYRKKNDHSFPLIKAQDVASFMPDIYIDITPYINLMIHAGYTKDVDLVEYCFQKYLIYETDEIVRLNKHDLGRSTSAAIFLGGLDEYSLQWLDSNCFLESDKSICSAFEYIMKKRSTKLVRYNLQQSIRLIDLISDKYRSYDNVTKSAKKRKTLYILQLCSSYFLGHWDVDAEKYAHSKIDLIDPTLSPDAKRKHFDTFFRQVMYTLISSFRSDLPDILQQMREKYSFGEYEFCAICYIAFDTENFDVIKWLDKTKGLRKLLLTKGADVTTSSKNCNHYYLVDQIVLCINGKTNVDPLIFNMLTTTVDFENMEKAKLNSMLEHTMLYISRTGNISIKVSYWFDQLNIGIGYQL